MSKRFIPANHIIQWDHPKLDIVVQFFVDDDYIEVEHVFGYVYGKQCIASLFHLDRLIDDFQASTAYDDYMDRLRA